MNQLDTTLEAVALVDPIGYGRAGQLFKQAEQAIVSAHKANRITDTIRDVRIDWLYKEYRSAPNESQQISACQAVIAMCRENF
jgi:hypothetical protein